jgi:hypothetical protein
MLGNLHVRFGVGAGVQLPGLHHTQILSLAGESGVLSLEGTGPRPTVRVSAGQSFVLPELLLPS